MISPRSEPGTPNQLASVPANWSIEVLGSRLPDPVPLVLRRATVRNTDGRGAPDEPLTLDRTTDNKVVVAPTVVRAVAVGGQRPSEFRAGEQRNLLAYAQGIHGALKSRDARAHPVQIAGLLGDEVVMQVVAAGCRYIKTCRLTPSMFCAAINRATTLSWLAKLFPVAGNWL